MEAEKKGPVKVVLKTNALPKIDVQSLRQLLDKSLKKPLLNIKDEPGATSPKQPKLCDEPDTKPRLFSITRQPKAPQAGGKTRTISIKTPTRNPYLDKIHLKDSDLSGNKIVKGRPSFKCCFCDFYTTVDEDYRNHIAHHIEKKTLRCSLCAFSAEEITAYNEHMKNVHQRKPLRTAYACSLCSYKSLTIDALRKHKSLMNHFDKPTLFKCQLCTFSSTDIHKLLDHIEGHSTDLLPCAKCTGKRKLKNHDTLCPEFTTKIQAVERFEKQTKSLFSCTLCDFQCNELLFLMAHIKAHVKKIHEDVGKEDMPFCCTMCDYRCVRPSKLKLHMKTHGTGAVFRCKLCNFQSKDNVHYKIHRKTHAADDSFTCFVCSAKFTNSDELKKHTATHWKSEPFACTICDYVCLTKSRLLIHMDTHAKASKVLFPCPLCPNKYSTSCSLKDHIRTHGGIRKPLKCDSCDYTCFTSELLRIHMQKHAKAEEFSCDLCLSKYSTEAELKSHILNHVGMDTSFDGNTEKLVDVDDPLSGKQFFIDERQNKYGYTEDNVLDDSDDDNLEDTLDG